MRKLEVTDMHRLTAEQFHLSEKMPLTVVLDNVRSMHNVGSVLRTADAFRVERVIMCGITATPPHPELHKTALGAEDSVDWQYRKDTAAVVDALHADGYTVYAVEQCEGSVMIDRLTLPSATTKAAIVLGNEVHGVQQQVVDLCDGCIEIPQFGTKHSLNVSVAAGIAIWEMARRMLLTTAVLLMLGSQTIAAQDSYLTDDSPINLDSLAMVMPTWYLMKNPYYYEGEWIPVIQLPEIPVYAPYVFKNSAERRKYDRMVHNVKRVLPLAKQANRLIRETYEVLEMLPDDEARSQHMKNVEKEIKRVYTPQIKRLTYSQGKLLIKLIDRECNQSSYQIVRAFLGQTKAVFYQVVAWTFRASLKKRYDPQGSDAMTERIVRQVEVGAL